jgi:hypothetical protein
MSTRVAALLLVAGLALVGCSSDAGSDASSDGGTGSDGTTTTDAAGDAADDDAGEAAVDAMTEGFLTDLRAGLVEVMSEDQADCVVSALDVDLDAQLDEGALQQKYDECGVRVSQIVAVQLYDSYVEGGVSPRAAACVRDAVAELDDAAMEAFSDEQGAALAARCGVDEDLLGG